MKCEGSMSHQDALNKILANACSNPAYYPDDGRTHEYTIDLCCGKVIVIAQPIPDEKFGYVIFDVLTPSERAERLKSVV